jgi:hydrogenase nickel insertion protein HypA
MHEMSLVQYAMDAVEQRALGMGIHHVYGIYLVVGEMRGALPDLMDYGFRVLSRSRPLFFGAQLHMELRGVEVQCNDCAERYGVQEFHHITCPACGSGAYTLVQGNELYIDYFEGE